MLRHDVSHHGDLVSAVPSLSSAKEVLSEPSQPDGAAVTARLRSRTVDPATGSAGRDNHAV